MSKLWSKSHRNCYKQIDYTEICMTDLSVEVSLDLLNYEILCEFHLCRNIPSPNSSWRIFICPVLGPTKSNFTSGANPRKGKSKNWDKPVIGLTQLGLESKQGHMKLILIVTRRDKWMSCAFVYFGRLGIRTRRFEPCTRQNQWFKNVCLFFSYLAAWHH